MRIGIVALETLVARGNKCITLQVNHTRFGLHDNKAVAEIYAPIFEELVTCTESDDMTVSRRKHRGALVLVGRIHIVGVAYATGKVAGKVILEAEARAPCIAPIEIFCVALVLALNGFGEAEVDMVNRAPFSPRKRSAATELLREVIIGAHGEGRGKNKLRSARTIHGL